jgi:hypothetical protein
LLPKKKTSSGFEFVSGLADGASAMPAKWSRPVFSFRFYEGKISRTRSTRKTSSASRTLRQLGARMLSFATTETVVMRLLRWLGCNPERAGHRLVAYSASASSLLRLMPLDQGERGSRISKSNSRGQLRTG